MIEKIQKLLSLSKSCNEAEAQAAFQKAKQLADKMGLELELIAIQENREAEKLPFEKLNVSYGRLPVIHKYTVRIIQTYFHAKMVYFTVDRKSRVVFVGRKDKVEIAKEVYNQLLLAFDYLWKNYKARYNLKNKDKASYLYGLEQGFISKLEEQEEENKREAIMKLPVDIQEKSSEKLEIVLVNEKQALLDAFNGFYPSCRTRSACSINITRRDVYEDGYRDGKNINIDKSKALCVG